MKKVIFCTLREYGKSEVANMEFDESKKLDVEISQNNFVENRVNKKRKKKGVLDALDVAIIPVAIGVFVSLGFLFANIFRATSIVETLSNISSIISSI